MGTGVFHPRAAADLPGTFDLRIAFQWNVNSTPGAEDAWRNAFEWASVLLDMSTGGQVRIGRITWTNNMTNNQSADVWVFDDATTAATHGGSGLGTPGIHTQVGTVALGRMGGGGWIPGTLGDFTHEFGHYLFDLRDEYTGDGCFTDDTVAEAAGACLMQFASQSLLRLADGSGQWSTNPSSFRVANWCTPDNHDLVTPDTQQSVIHGESCWETIEDAVLYDITAPAAAPPVPGPVPERHITSWRRILENYRYCLVLDASGSMNRDDAIDGVIFGARFWTDLEVLFRNDLAVVVYATNVFTPLLLELQPIDAGNLGATRTKIDAISAGGSTNITSALQAGRNELSSPDPAQRRTMILLSDGRHNQGAEPTNTDLDAMAAQGINVHTVGYGQFVQETLLQRIASRTSGQYRWIAQPDQSDAPQVIMDALMEIAGESHSGLLSSGDFSIGEEDQQQLFDRPEPPYSDDDLEFVAAEIEAGALDDPGRIGVHRLVLVEQDSDRVSFVLNHRPSDRVALYLFRPTGDIVRPDDGDVELVDSDDDPYAFYVVTEPEAGEWTMAAVRTSRGDIHGAMLAFSENEAIVVGIAGSDRVHEQGEPVVLFAQVSSRVVLTGLRSIVTDTGRGLDPNQPIDAAFEEEEPGKGWYRLELPPFSDPGSYELMAEFEWTSETREARDPLWDDQHGIETPDPYRPPPFRRVRRFQIQVGPLSDGEDLDEEYAAT